MHGRCVVLLGLMLAAPAEAQQADCQADPPATANMPLALDLRGLPGVPRSARGQVFADVPVAPHGTLCGAAEPVLPNDILHGDQPPDEVLHGGGNDDVLTGRPRGPVYIDVR